ncbi:M13-type metalloendopeptidase [Luteimonas sp. JM171]|uniref:M13-type metalloendopeptidase n=1 Tax=Luteimonas sp. JM171 TaxID=1896164 RepID=UPI0008585B1E|nr:M13 family metallopeptidase [Luteimonas sp. JM171]AOH37508.1 hypothetical protein BGP89_09370 [Luteimonas sp. JM171]
MPTIPFPPIRPLALAAAAVLLAGLSTGAGAQQAAAEPTACTDFHAFVNKDWMAANALPGPGIATASALQELRELTSRQQRELLDAAMAAPGNERQQALGNFWASGLDEAAVEAAGAQPIAPLLSRIDGIRRARDIPGVIAEVHQAGIPVAFEFNAGLDLADPTRYIGYFTQGGLGLPGPEYYSRQDADTGALLERYRGYVRAILGLTGVPEAELDAQTAAVIDMERHLAARWQPLAQMRDPRNNHALVEASSLRSQFRNLRLDQFLKALDVGAPQVSLANPDLFATLDYLVANNPVEQWKPYLRFHVANAMAPYLSQPFRDAEFEFHGRVLRGDAAPAGRPEQVLAAINNAAGPLLAQEYVAAHLPQATRERAQTVASQVRDALAQAVARSEWMDPASRAEAGRKLEALQIEVGAPEWPQDTALPRIGRESFGANMLAASAWRHAREMDRIGAASASRRWDVLPQEPAVAYDMARNKLVVTAAVLQPPVLDMSANPAAHYGSLGALVGHELGRSVDILGRHVDADGNVRNWWTAADETAWNDRAHGLATQYHAYPFPGSADAMVDGTRHRDANAADLAGVELAWAALQQADPQPAPESAQAFFRAWATLWRQQMSPAAVIRAAADQARTPNKWRANGPLANLPAFGETFGCDAGTPMRRPEAEQVRIWR